MVLLNQISNLLRTILLGTLTGCVVGLLVGFFALLTERAETFRHFFLMLQKHSGVLILWVDFVGGFFAGHFLNLGLSGSERALSKGQRYPPDKRVLEGASCWVWLAGDCE